MDNQTLRDLHWLLDVIQSSDIGIVVLDRELNIEVFNRFMQAHSGRPAEAVIGESILNIFPELSGSWLCPRVETVFETGVPLYSNWQQRPWVFQFQMDLPVHTDVPIMYQNTVLLPLRAANTQVERVALVVYDTTAEARGHHQLAEAQQALLSQSRTDALTGLWNRGYWDERLQEEYQRVQRSGTPASLVMLDIDHFKQINDRYGHPCGDEVIRMLGQSISRNSRAIDICGRYGGEEFALVLPNTAAEGAFSYCERLRKEVGQQTVRTQTGESLRVTISLGLAELTPELGGGDIWVASADQALYQAKASGRNCTAVYSPAR